MLQQLLQHTPQHLLQEVLLSPFHQQRQRERQQREKQQQQHYRLINGGPLGPLMPLLQQTPKVRILPEAQKSKP